MATRAKAAKKAANKRAAAKSPGKTNGVRARPPAKKVLPRKAATRRNSARRRRTYAQLFLDKLAELAGPDQGTITNRQLREELGWDEVRYARIKTQLRGEGLIVLGTGRGGTVATARPAANEALKLFISYSHADERLKEAVMKHLRPLERLKLISQWHDRKLMPGDEWGQEISANLEAADIVLVLVSIDFLNSKYCYDIELDRALERHAAGDCRVVPIILRGCLWQHAPFAKLQALPRDAKALTTWPDLDESLATVAEGVRLLAEDLLASR